MEIILVQQQSEAPEDAKILAQANLKGGGDIEEQESPSTPLPAPFPQEKPEIAAPPPAESQPPAESAADTPEVVTETEPVPAEVTEQLAVESTEADERLAEKLDLKSEEAKPVEEVADQRKPEENVRDKQMPEKPEIPPTPSATALMTNSLKIASLSAQIRQKLQAKAERPRRKFISASTKEYKYASYMEAWRSKVERVGNLNYPEAARKNKLSGNLILDVALNKDGSINQITVRRSSGHQVLDDASIRIVELAAPYSPFPDHIREETDILHITRTWQFLNSNKFK
ncbi:MAG: TonB family protein [Gammaproteobacteria bacterium]|nr:TonB family protein [Gammaproteobacteria bacterium]